MRRAAMVTIACIILSGCGRDEPEIQATNASVEEVAEQVREASAGEQFIRPGKWVSQVRFEDMAAPGMPDKIVKQLNEAMNQTQQFESCLTEEQTKRPQEGFFTGGDDECRYENFTMGKGKIDATLRCSKGKAIQTTQMTGSYSPESYQLQMTSSTDALGSKAGEMRVRMRIDAKRVGQCGAVAENQKQGVQGGQ